MKTEQILLYGGGALLAYELFLKPKTSAPGTSIFPPGTLLNPAPKPVPVYQAPGTVYQAPGAAANVGINSGVKGGNGSFYTVSNYNQLVAANPNLSNPNYQMSAAENAQYLANYQDLQTGLPTWVGQKMLDGQTATSLTMAIQGHWRIYGCAEHRIFVPMQPPSGAAFIPPPANPKSSGGGSSWVSTALGIATTLVGILGEPEQLNNADCQMLFTMSAVVKDILPLYDQADPLLTRLIDNRMTTLLNQYS